MRETTWESTERCVPVDHASTITGNWLVTAKDHHQRYSGELQIEVDEPIDITEHVRRFLRATAEESSKITDDGGI